MGDIRTRHVAGDKNGIGVVRADGGVEHRATAARTKYAEIARPLRKQTGRANGDAEEDKKKILHRLLLEWSMLMNGVCGEHAPWSSAERSSNHPAFWSTTAPPCCTPI